MNLELKINVKIKDELHSNTYCQLHVLNRKCNILIHKSVESEMHIYIYKTTTHYSECIDACRENKIQTKHTRTKTEKHAHKLHLK